MTGAVFAYDAVPYDTEANSEAHPRSMGTLGRLFGIETALPRRARVLEIGCGDGEHMIAAASYLPEATFVGFDLSSEAIARGRAAAEACGVTNVELHHRDLCEVANAPMGSFDYVVAHGVYSWVPEAIRADVLRVIRDALAPKGVGFLSFNALPGWELRRALRAIMREASAAHDDPRAKVQASLAAIETLVQAGDASGAPAFTSVLASAAREYLDHVARATPPDAPFSRYVFHDLLADHNDAFSVDEMSERARRAGLAVLCDTPGARPVSEIRAMMRESGSPFLQVLLVRDDARLHDLLRVPPAEAAPSAEAIGAMHLWADLATAGDGAFATTSGAVLRAAADSALARAAAHAPAFVAVRSLADDDAARAALASDLLAAVRDGTLTVAAEPIALVTERPSEGGALPPVSAHVRARASEAVMRGAPSAVVTSALHRSFRVPWDELVIVRELDGTTTVAELEARLDAALRSAPAARIPASVATATDRARVVREHLLRVLSRFARHGFFVERTS
ncbi:MAG: methyltransferase domain-containing protein [Deltaproteobacteria bacterium]|nr:methyltransferase domain-containing protein [Deltaproteobacteria bacterium]